ncbi:hypothetical protein J1N35_030315 [Gossypium stocksii]|uniref:Uncharacterized protein n=1 Tax=Gossypium stocksii TaxID=47602 RepID=A0A9D3UZD5_9ROSI|nr:hypothetical protein J1N35_030315 [Gossypium stocksii]
MYKHKRKLRYLHPTYLEIEALTEGGEGAIKDIYVCRFNWISRSGDKVAHAMAQDGLMGREECFWMEEAPLLVVTVVNEDRRLLDPP